MVTSQAVPVPTRSVSTPTPAISPSVRWSAPGNTLAIKCGHVSPLGWSAMTAMVMMGASAISERMAAAADQRRLPLSTSRSSRWPNGVRARLSGSARGLR